MNILITGAAGFIGSNLTRKILETGDSVTGIDDLSHGNMLNLESVIKHPRFRFIQGDVCDRTTFKGLRHDAAIHLASQKIPRYTSALRTLEDNFEMQRNIIATCLENKSKLVFASTSDVYGKNNCLPFNEESNIVIGSTTIKRWAYASSKLTGEQLIVANQEEHDLEYTIMRLFGSYGPHQNLTWWGGPQAIFIQNLLEGKPIEIHGDGYQTRTFTYVDDTVQGIMKCIYHSAAKNEIFNVASDADEEISIKDLADTIHRMMPCNGIAKNIRYIPYSSFGRYEDVMRRVPDNTKIKRMLGFTPSVSLEQGLRITIDWQTKIFEGKKTQLHAF